MTTNSSIGPNTYTNRIQIHVAGQRTRPGPRTSHTGGAIPEGLDSAVIVHTEDYESYSQGPNRLLCLYLERNTYKLDSSMILDTDTRSLYPPYRQLLVWWAPFTLQLVQLLVRLLVFIEHGNRKRSRLTTSSNARFAPFARPAYGKTTASVDGALPS